MKKLLVLLFMIGSYSAFAVKAPFAPKDEKLLTESIMNMGEYGLAVGSTTGKAAIELPSADGNMSKRHFRATFDTAVDGTAVGAYGLGVYIPANAVITEAFFHTTTQFTDSGSGTVAYHCEDADNLYAAADVTGISAGTLTSGIDSASLANAVQNIAAECEITATIATVSQMTGAAVLFGEYWVAD